MIKGILLPILFLSFSPSYEATIYQWIDKNGNYDCADDLEKVPPATPEPCSLRKGGRRGSRNDAPVFPPKSMPQEDEIRKDIFGIGEDWWREKVCPWEGQLKEASPPFFLTTKSMGSNLTVIGKRRMIYGNEPR